MLYSTEERMEIIRELRPVDEVIIYQDVDKIVQKIDFDVFAIGGDQLHEGFQRAVNWCKENGKEVVRLQRTPKICSSNIKDSLEKK